MTTTICTNPNEGDDGKKVRLSDRFEITALQLHLLVMLTDYDTQAIDIANLVFERKVKE